MVKYVWEMLCPLSLLESPKIFNNISASEDLSCVVAKQLCLTLLKQHFPNSFDHKTFLCLFCFVCFLFFCFCFIFVLFCLPNTY